jgi:hypothetical protein
MTKPPATMPTKLVKEFTLDGKMEVVYKYSDAACKEVQDQINANFTPEELEKSIHRTARGETNYYGKTDTWLYDALEKYPVKGKKVCIVGSTYPWYEAMMISYGAAVVDVIEYSDRSIEHDVIKYIKPDMIDEGSYDVCLSISSFEHDGLGRYGDPIDPTGDFTAMNKMKNIVKPNGTMLLALPVGIDRIYFNVHRVYGKHRLPLLLKEWEQVDSFGYSDAMLARSNDGLYQPVFVLRNT